MSGPRVVEEAKDDTADHGRSPGSRGTAGWIAGRTSG